jgi:phage tail sheath gpL-like
MREETDDPAVNRIGDAIDGLFGAADLAADKPTDAEIESALVDGLSIINYDAQDDMYLVAPITTYSQDSLGNRDDRLRYVSAVSGTYAFVKDLRTALRIEFAGAKITRDLTGDEEPLPPGVTEERDVKAFVVDRGNIWVRRGVLRKDALDAAVADGSLSATVNDTDESQVDIRVPLKIIKPLAKIGVVAQRIG